MWMMMGCNDSHRQEFNGLRNPLSGPKLRPLVPRVPASAVAAATSPPACFNLMNHDTDIFSLNYHLAAMTEQNKKEYLDTQQVVVSSRWNPTPEQLQTLKDLYQRGTRTPSAEQIQLITSQLQQYGKIEGKNVFYWFQNHKARERQKRQRRLRSISDEQPHTDSEANGQNNRASPTNSSTIPEKSAGSRQEAEKAEDAEYCKASDELVHFNGAKSQQRKNLVERKNMWQMMHFSRPSSKNTNHPAPTATNPMKLQEFDILEDEVPLKSSARSFENGIKSKSTLQLFPLRSAGDENEGVFDNDVEVMDAAMASDIRAQQQFFEFL